jgi:hypothetical protein
MLFVSSHFLVMVLVFFFLSSLLKTLFDPTTYQPDFNENATYYTLYMANKHK